jgi:signal transduction histidine kinase
VPRGRNHAGDQGGAAAAAIDPAIADEQQRLGELVVCDAADPDRRPAAPAAVAPERVSNGRDDARARIVAAADEARRRLERDLHDGAQQHFVLASLSLERAAARLRGTPAEALLAEASEQMRLGLAELRDLARGIHPAVLSQRGLAAALAGVAARSPLPVSLRVSPARFAPATESASYFTVAEALTNVAKHARASHASVSVDVDDDTVTAEIVDDGIGGADTTSGSGLRGLIDRLDALGGTLSIDSPRGGPTIIRARVPSTPT